MGLSKPIIITSSAVDTSNLATKSDLTALQNAVANLGGMKVKSVQKGTVNIKNTSNNKKYVDATISGVDTAKCIAFVNLGYSYSDNSTSSTAVTCTVPNSTTVRVYTPSSGYGDVYVPWYVIEFE